MKETDIEIFKRNQIIESHAFREREINLKRYENVNKHFDAAIRTGVQARWLVSGIFEDNKPSSTFKIHYS